MIESSLTGAPLVKYLAFVLATLLAPPSVALACEADVELVKSEAGGSDVLHTFRITRKGTGPATVTFEATTEYLRRGKLYRRTSNYSKDVSAQSELTEKPEHTQVEIDEIVAVKIENIRCTP